MSSGEHSDDAAGGTRTVRSDEPKPETKPKARGAMRPKIESLEPRVLLSADPLAGVLIDAADSAEATEAPLYARPLEELATVEAQGVAEAATAVGPPSAPQGTHTPLRPVLILPGIVGSGPSEGNDDEWYTNRSIHPTKLTDDPIIRTYDDLEKTLDTVGYTPGVDLFMATYDWRLNPAPLDGSIDGRVAGLTGASITDDTFEYGVDYLGYWLKTASDAWTAQHGSPPASVDLIAHSTGGLVARAYLQSDAYGDGLPTIENLSFVGTPQRGASKPWAALNNDFGNDLGYRLVVSKMMNQSYQRYLDGAVIRGADGDLDPSQGILAPADFIDAYAPTVRGLLATYDFLDDGDGELENVNSQPTVRNNLLLDLNDGLDLDFTLEQLDATANHLVDLGGGDIRDPNAFIDLVGGAVDVIYGVDSETVVRVVERTGPDLGAEQQADLLSFRDLVGRLPGVSETWFEEKATDDEGDGTVPTSSSAGQFLGDPLASGSSLAFHAIGAGGEAGADDEDDRAHGGLVSNFDVQKSILERLGLVVDTDFELGHISTDLLRTGSAGAAEALLAAIALGIYDGVPLGLGSGQISTEEATVLADGLLASAGLSDSFSSESLLGQEIPVLGRSLGELIELKETLDAVIFDPILPLVQGGTPDLSAILNAVTTAVGTQTNIDPSSFSIDGVSLGDNLTQLGGILGEDLSGALEFQDQLVFSIDFDWKKTLPAQSLSLGSEAAALGLEFNGTADVDLLASVSLDFGVDRTEGLPSAEAFFIRLGDVRAEAKIKAGVDGNPGLDAGLDVGFFEAGVTGGVLDLEASIRIGVNNPNAEADPTGRLTLAEIQATSASDLLSITGTAPLTVSLPTSASLGSFALNGTVDLQSSDALNVTPTLNLTGFEDIDGFASFNSDSVLDSILNLSQAFLDLGASELLDFEIPFTDVNLGGSLDAGFDFIDSLQDLSEAPLFDSAQTLGTQLALGLGIDPAAVAAEFDAIQGELTYEIDYSKLVQIQAPFSFDASLPSVPIFGELGGLSTSGLFGASGEFEIAFRLGFDVSPVEGRIDGLQDAPANGSLSGPATFNLTVAGADAVAIVVDTAGNTTFDELIDDINTAFVTAGVADQVYATREGNRVSLRTRALAAPFIGIDASSSDPAVSELGLPASAFDSDSVAQHVFLENVGLDGSLDLANQVMGEARLPFVKLIGEFEASGSAGIQSSLAGGGRITLMDLINGIAADPTALGTLNVTGSAQLDVNNVQLMQDVGSTPIDLSLPGTIQPGQHQIRISLPEGFDLGGVSVDFNEALLGALPNLENLSFDSVLTLLRQVGQSLLDMADHDVLSAKIPGIGLSLGELFGEDGEVEKFVGFAEEILELAESLDTVEARSSALGEVEARIKTALDAILPTPIIPVLSFDPTGGSESLQLSLQFDRDVSGSVDLNVDLAAIPGIPEAGNLIEVAANDPIDFDGSLDFDLTVGLDVSNPLVPRVYLDDNTGITLEARIVESDVDIDVNVLSAGALFARGGRLILDANGVDDGSAGIDAADAPASISVGFASGAGRQYIGTPSEISTTLGALDIAVVGALDLSLPVYSDSAGLNQIGAVPIAFSVSDFETLLEELVAGNVTSFTGSAPDLQQFVDGLDLLGIARSILPGFESVFGKLEGALGAVLDFEVPLVGVSLGSLPGVGDFVGGLVGSLSPTLQSELADQNPASVASFLASLQTAMQTALQNVFPSALVNLAGDLTNDFRFEISVGDMVSTSVALDADLGIPALGIELGGSLDLLFDWSSDFVLGGSLDDGFYVEFGQDPITASLSVLLDSASQLTGSLGFLELAVTQDPNQDTEIAGNLVVNVNDLDGRLSLTDLAGVGVGGLGGLFDVDLTGNVDIHLDGELSSDFGNIPLGLPTLYADVDFAWDLANLDAGPTMAGLTNIGFDTSDLFTELLADVLNELDEYLGIFDPALDVLTARIPVLSDVSFLRGLLDDDGDGKVTLLDAVALLGGELDLGLITSGLPFVANLLDGLDDVTSALASDSATDFRLGIGDLSLMGQDLGDVAGLADFQVPDLVTDFASAIDGLSIDTATKTALKDFAQTVNTGATGFDLSLPWFGSGNWSSLINPFLGRDVDLIRIDLPELNLDFTLAETTFQIFGPIVGTIGGRLTARADIAIGYDTFGLRAYKDDGFADESLLSQGFFVLTNEKDGEPAAKGNAVNELEIGGELLIGAGAGLSVGGVGFSITAAGSVGATIGYDFPDLDPDGAGPLEPDGKTRIHELADCNFELTGEFSAGLSSKASLKLGFVSLTKRFNIAEVTLLNFGDGCDHDGPPGLASLNETTGALRLNVGQDSGSRIRSGVDDENYAITLLEDENLIRVAAFGRNQDFDASLVTLITGDFGVGRDRLTIDPRITVPAWIVGGLGQDEISGGGGNDVLLGGQGSIVDLGGLVPQVNVGLDLDPAADILIGFLGDDQILGGFGDDEIQGGEGNDILRGGDGDDTISGQQGQDQLFGDSGDDLLEGGDGADQLFGGVGLDTLEGDEGGDQLFGEDGADILAGQDGDDFLFGGVGADLLLGGAGADTLEGEEEADVLYGGSGDDVLYGHSASGVGDDAASDVLLGDFGRITIAGVFYDADDDADQGAEGADILHGQLGDDRIAGGAGDDDVFGGDGNDQVWAGAGEDDVFGEAGDDTLLGGAGNDRLLGGAGIDTVFGDAGEDVVEGNAGADFLHGGADADEVYGHSESGAGDDGAADTLFGQSGDDRLFGQLGGDTLWGDFGRDILEGNAGADELHGGAGQDLLFGHSVSGSGDDGSTDVLFGDQDEDQLFGQGGADELHGGDGDDLLSGGAGNDLAYGEGDRDVIEGDGGADALFGGAGGDRIYGHSESGIGDDDSADELFGDFGVGDVRGQSPIPNRAGRDLLLGQGGNDTLRGEEEGDWLLGGLGNDLAFGGSGGDWIAGEAGVDELHGDEGQDHIFGNEGADQLFGDAGRDLLEGGDGDDTIAGGADDDLLLGQAGADTLFGDAGDDELRGGAEEDEIHGGLGSDLLLAGSGLVNRLFGDEGDDRIYGSDEGGEDPDLLDATYFGDVIEGGAGDDRIFGLGGADFIQGGAGNDFVDGGDRGDRILGNEGDDELRGGRGDDRLEGGADQDALYGERGMDLLLGEAGDDRLDGGADADVLQGAAGDDSLFGGGGVGDQLFGGDGEDRLRGSDDGADQIFGEGGRDHLFGQGGNDFLDGGAGDDILEGDAGDDVLEGGAGRDLLLGGADHDVLYGHSVSGAGDDLASDTLFGDFGTNADESGSGGDQLFGQGGSDFAFGEGGDDAIDPGTGLSDGINFGSGESGTPGDFVPPTPTNDPTVVAVGDPARAGATLPSELDLPGRWGDLAGSARDGGLSSGDAPALDPTIAIAANGDRYVAWADARSGNFEIYVAYHDGVAWQMLGGSAENGGISASALESRRPALTFDESGRPVVAWTETDGSTSDIHSAVWDATANGGSGGWVALGNSLGAGGLSALGGADFVQVGVTSTGVVVAYQHNTGSTVEIRVQRFDGTSWNALGPASVVSGASVDDLVLATDSTQPAIAWSQDLGGRREVFALFFDGTAWSALGGSGSGNGVSQQELDSLQPSLVQHGGDWFLAWQQVGDAETGESDIQVARYDGSQWVEAGIGALAGGGVSGRAGRSENPQLASAGGELHLGWVEAIGRDGEDALAGLYVQKWDGTQFGDPFAGAGDAEGFGVSYTGGNARDLSLAVDSLGRPFVAWQDGADGSADVLVRGDTFSVGRVFHANAVDTLQELLDAQDLGAGDVVVLSEGTQPGPVTIGAGDSGVTILGAPGFGTQLGGVLTIDGASDVVLQRISFDEGLVLQNDSNSRLVDLRVAGAGLVLDGSTDAFISQNSLSGDLVAVELRGPSSGRLESNEIASPETGVLVTDDFAGILINNTIEATQLGVDYRAGADLSGNRIFGSAVGVRVDAGTVATGFGFVGSSDPNEIYGNTVGVDLLGRMQNQIVRDNVTGVTGQGILGGTDLDLANRITGNGVGVDFDGTIQFNRIERNSTGVAARDGQQILSNLIYRNAQYGVHVDGVSDVRVIQNTLYAPVGDNLRIENAASEVEVRNNILWVDSGTNIFVDDDSLSGFQSDYNVLHAAPGAVLVRYVREFTDLIDWQADVARFDLHSTGTTVIDPVGARPAFLDLGRDDFRVAELVAGQQASSPSIDAGDPISDLAQGPAVYSNLLQNASFESGLTNWATNPSAGTGQAGPLPREGANYFLPGNDELGFAEQTVDLLGAGVAAGEIDAGDLDLVLSGRVRSLDQSTIDEGSLTIQFLDAGSVLIGEERFEGEQRTDAWDLVGGRVDVPAGARFAVYRYEAARLSGPTNEAFLDAAALYVISNDFAPNAGGYGNQAAETASAEGHLAIRFPDLYTDWELNRQQTIRWDSFGNPNSSSIRIDLYQDAADGPLFLQTLTAATADDGEFDWIPASAGLSAGTSGLRLLISRADEAAVFDWTAESFAVPEAGSDYFVDDASDVNDEYTPGATGSNRNTGKDASAPKPNLANLFRAYDVQPGATIHVDTGSFDMLSELRLSGTDDYGFGTEEGFDIQGPTDPGRVAELFPALPSLVPGALIEIADADNVSVTGLTLRDAGRGLYVRDSSDGFGASGIIASGHTGIGIDVQTDTPQGDFSNLTAFDNGGTGVRLSLTNAGSTNVNDVTAYQNAGDGLFLELTNASLTDLTNITAYLNGDDGLQLSVPSLGAAVGDIDLSNLDIHDNTDDGIVLSGTIGSLGDGTVIDNGDRGVVLLGVGPARIEALAIMGNRIGIDIDNSSQTAIVGSSDLSLERGNLVQDNTTIGIQAEGPVLVAGNVISGSTTGVDLELGADLMRNVIFGHTTGVRVDSAGSVLSENRIFTNTTGVFLNRGATLDRNVIYSNDLGVDGRQSGAPSTIDNFSLTNNLIYDNLTLALEIGEGDGITVRNNTFYASEGDGVVFADSARNINFRNNIIHVAAGEAIDVDVNAAPTFTANHNVYDVTGAGVLGVFEGQTTSTLGEWQAVTGQGGFSLIADPLFVDPDGVDNALGADGGANDGRDDDFHLQSQSGSFKGGSFAPVVDGITGLPVFLTATESADPGQSPAIDRGDAIDPVGSEPTESGGFINAGAFGGTDQASKSPDPYLTVFAPNGGGVVLQGTTVSIDWRSAGFAGDVSIEYSTAGLGGPFQTIAANETNDGQFDWLVDAGTFSPSGLYAIRVSSVGAPGVLDVSDEVFEVAPSAGIFYVNVAGDIDFSDNEYTTAAGDDANSGLTPGAPKASVQSVLDDYDLEPGDVIVIDTGNYLLSNDIEVIAEDAGVTFQGATQPGHLTLIDRVSTASATHTFEVFAPDVTIRDLELVRGASTIWAHPTALGFFLLDNVIRDGSTRGILLDSPDGVVTGNEFTGYTGTGDEGILLRGARGLIEQNEFHTLRIGVDLEGAGDDAVIRENLFRDFTDDGVQVSGGAVRALIFDNEFRDGSEGVAISQFGGATIEQNWFHGNSQAVRTLQAGTIIDNLFEDNTTHIRFTGNQTITGNTLLRGTTGLVNPSNYSGANGSQIQGNRIAGMSGSAITLIANSTGIDLLDNVIYSANHGIQSNSSNSQISGNLVYDTQTRGITADNANTSILNNTVVSTTGDGIRVDTATSGPILNNIVSVADGLAFFAAAVLDIDTVEMDHNLWNKTGPGDFAQISGRGYSHNQLYWRFGFGAKGRLGDPVFLDPAGPDGQLGVVGGVDFGADDDFRLDSTSPGIDAGDPSFSFDLEPDPNGGRINLGAFGGTAIATATNTPTIEITSDRPSKFELGDTVEIELHGAGLAPGSTLLLEVSLDGGSSWSTVSSGLTLDSEGDAQTTWTASGETAGHQGLFRATLTNMPTVQDTTDRAFLVSNAGSSFYINVEGDLDFSDNEYTTAAGDDANSGKTADSPLRSIATLLRQYDLEPGDTVFIDSGTYQTDYTVFVRAEDAGVRFQGPVLEGNEALIEGDTSDRDVIFWVDNASGVEFDSLAISGGTQAVLIDTGSDAALLSNLRIFDHTTRGTLVDADATILESDFTNVGNSDSEEAILVRDGTVVIQDNVIHDLSSTGTDGIQIESGVDFATITGNEIFLAENAIIIASPGLVEFNQLYNNRDRGVNATNGEIRFNTIWGHDVNASDNGIQAIGTNVWVHDNLVFQNRDGIFVDGGALVENNHVYGNTEDGISVAGGTIRGNRIYSNGDAGISADGNTALVESNLIYDNARGVVATFGLTLRGNTIDQVGGVGFRAVGLNASASLIEVDNNIFRVEDGVVFEVGAADQGDVVLDWNLVEQIGTTDYALFADVTLPDRASFFFFTGQEANGIEGPAGFVDPAGPDGLLGFSGGVDSGADDDFHLLPGSVGIDRADPSLLVGDEPEPNGDRRNLGGYGGTDEATASAPGIVQVLSPNGLEKLRVGEVATIQYRSDGLAPGATVDLDVSIDGGANWNPVAVAQPVDANGDGSFDWTPDQETTASNALIRIRQTGVAGIVDVSDTGFAIGGAGNTFYVNDSSLVGDEYATQIGSDTNTGTSPDSPLASLNALLRAYDFEPGDTIFVDTGAYDLSSDVVIEAEDAGVRLQGAVQPGNVTLLNRLSDVTTTASLEIAADDVSVDGFEITGGGRAVFVNAADRVSISNSFLHDNSSEGVRISGNSDDVVVRDNEIAASGQEGIQIFSGQRYLFEDNIIRNSGGDGVDISGTARGTLRGGEIFGAGGWGVDAHRNSGGLDVVIEDSIIRNNTSGGVLARGDVVVQRNLIFAHNAVNAEGIIVTDSGQGAIARDNIVFDNGIGIAAGPKALVENNTIFGNSQWGIGFSSNFGNTPTLLSNTIFSNPVGIRDGSNDGGRVEGNLIYDSSEAGVRFVSSAGKSIFRNNTIVQSVGSTLDIQTGSNYRFFNNIFSIESGVAVDIGANALGNVTSEGNFFHLAGPGASVGSLNGTVGATLGDWQTLTGFDLLSLSGDPLFLDPDGPDNTLGESVIGSGSGADDNFALGAGSPAIDAGNGDEAPATDLFGNLRVDDLSTVDTGTGTPTFTDLGAIEFQGDSSDAIPPTLISVAELPVEGGSVAPIFSALTLDFSEGIDRTSGDSTSNFELVEAGLDELFETVDDVVISLTSEFTGGSTIVLDLDEGPLAEGSYRFTVAGTLLDTAGNVFDGDGDGSGGDALVRTFDVESSLRVTSATLEPGGSLMIDFNRALDASTLSLIDTEAGDFGAPDLTLVGASVGDVSGSLIVDPGLQRLTFVPTGGPLAQDTYTLTLRSAADGVTSPSAGLLDGDGDLAPGGDFTQAFVVGASSNPTLSLPDFVRGAGQSIELGLSNGIPLRVSDAAGIDTLSLTVTYDATLMTLTGLSTPAGISGTIDTTTPGVALITLTASSTLSAGALDLATILADVPAGAIAGAVGRITLGGVVANAGALALDVDDAVHLSAYLGDTTGNLGFSSLDMQRVLRVAGDLDSGFAAFPRVDGSLIGDIDRDGDIDLEDARRIGEVAVGLSPAEIPSLPAGVIASSDPQSTADVRLRTGPIIGGLGLDVTVPVEIDDASGLESADLMLAWDPAVLDFARARIDGGLSLFADGLLVVNQNGSTLTVAIASPTPRLPGSGTLLDLDLNVPALATPGLRTEIDLQSTELDEGGISLVAPPITGPDAADTMVAIAPIGDANLDGIVSDLDFDVWVANYQTGVGFDQGDFNLDGTVDEIDYVLWADHFGDEIDPPASPSQALDVSVGGAPVGFEGLVQSAFHSTSEADPVEDAATSTEIQRVDEEEAPPEASDPFAEPRPTSDVVEESAAQVDRRREADARAFASGFDAQALSVDAASLVTEEGTALNSLPTAGEGASDTAAADHGETGRISPSASISKTAVVARQVKIGPHARVEAQATIEEGAVLKAKARVGAAAYLGRGSVIGRGAQVGEGAWIGANSTIESGAIVPDHAVVLEGGRVRSAHRSEGLDSSVGNDFSELGTVDFDERRPKWELKRWWRR